MRTTHFKLGELFCGPGGMAIAAKGLTPVVGHDGRSYALEHAWGVDLAPYAIDTFNANGCGEGICKDAWKFVREDLDERHRVNALAFGFPCNSFSEVGERKGVNDETYGNLYQTGIAVLNAYAPLWFVAENVSGLKARDKGRQFERILHELSNAGKGYVVTPHLYKFEEYGVPQARHRWVIVGIRADEAAHRGIDCFRPPAPTHGPGHDNPFVTCEEAISTLSSHQPTTTNLKRSRTSDRIAWRLRFTPPGGNAWKLDELVDGKLYPDEELLDYLKVNLPWYETEIAPLGSAVEIRAKIEEVRLHCTRARMSHIYRRLDPAKPAWTLTGSGGGGTHVYHWSEPRALTNPERAALQTFPQNYQFCGTKEQIRKQIGMAVPTRAARQIFQAILKTFAGADYPSLIPERVYRPGEGQMVFDLSSL